MCVQAARREKEWPGTYQASLAHALGLALLDLHEQRVNSRLERRVLDHVDDALVHESAHDLVGHLDSVQDKGKRVAQKVPHVIPANVRHARQQRASIAHLLRSQVCHHALDRLLEQPKHIHPKHILHVGVLLVAPKQLRQRQHGLVARVPKLGVGLQNQPTLLLHLRLAANSLGCQGHLPGKGPQGSTLA